MIFAGIDWAEGHHDVAVMDEGGVVVSEHRITDGVEGVRRFHQLVAQYQPEPADVIVGIETAHGLLPQALVAGGYLVYEINPLATNRYRDRHHLSGAKSDRGDAKMLADLVRTDRHNHRPFLGDSELAQAVKVLARCHQSLIWARQVHLNQLRNSLRDFYAAALAAFPQMCSPSERDCPECLVVLEAAPTPASGRALSRARIAALLRHAGRQRSVERRASEIQGALRASQLELSELLSNAYGASARATARIVLGMNTEIDTLEIELTSHFGRHSDAEIYLSLPGLGRVLGARALGEFGDAPNRFQNGKARRNYATTSPVTRASGTVCVVSRRHGGNRRLGELAMRWAFCSLQRSPGASRYFQAHHAGGRTGRRAQRALANRWIGILHGCLARHERYREDVAWPSAPVDAAA